MANGLYPKVLSKADSDAVWEDQQRQLAEAQATVAAAQEAERARLEESMGLADRPDDNDIEHILVETFGGDTAYIHNALSHPDYERMKWQFRKLLEHRPTANDTGTGFITLKAREQMLAAIRKLADACRAAMNSDPMALARLDAEREFRQIERESERDRRPPSMDPQDQIKRWFDELQKQGASPAKIERVADRLRWTQGAGKPGVIEAVRYGAVFIDGEQFDIRDF
jgi:hypothetical protein